MAKKIIFEDSYFALNLSGFHFLAALKSKVQIPYASIRSIQIAPFRLSIWHLRAPGTWIPFTAIAQGTFYYQKKKYFLSTESSREKIVIELVDHDYDFVVLEVDDAPSIVAKIREK